MSVGPLGYYVVPVKPDWIGSCDEFDWLVLEALNQGDMFEQTTKESLRREPVVLEAKSRAAIYLRGALTVLPSWPDYIPASENPAPDRTATHAQLKAFLAELDARGALLIGVEE